MQGHLAKKRSFRGGLLGVEIGLVGVRSPWGQAKE